MQLSAAIYCSTSYEESNVTAVASDAQIHLFYFPVSLFRGPPPAEHTTQVTMRPLTEGTRDLEVISYTLCNRTPLLLETFLTQHPQHFIVQTFTAQTAGVFAKRDHLPTKRF